ncbi:MAG: S1 RNA-binding domain-containing protein [Armatimonadota bacterium]|nr:S1 RNA-binding domain-containing protein [Armatimonadota bacterium]
MSSPEIEIGSTVEGAVVKLADYGAIVRLPGGKMGLVHISEVTDAYVRDVHDYFHENDRIFVKVLKLNNKGRYELSTKQADAPQTLPVEQPPEKEKHPVQRQDEERRSYKWEARQKSVPQNFEEQLSRFMKDSEERLHDIKRNVESKRGGGGGGRR